MNGTWPTGAASSIAVAVGTTQISYAVKATDTQSRRRQRAERRVRERRPRARRQRQRHRDPGRTPPPTAHTAQFSVAWDGTTFNQFAGTDVAGTINGQAATGSGQQLLVPFATPGIGGLALNITGNDARRPRDRSRTRPVSRSARARPSTTRPIASPATSRSRRTTSTTRSRRSTATSPTWSCRSPRTRRCCRSQFTNMETVINSLKTTGDTLTNALAQLPSFNAASKRRTHEHDGDVRSGAQQVRERLGAHDVARASDRRAVRPRAARPRARARPRSHDNDIYDAHTALMHAQQIVDELLDSLDLKQWPGGASLAAVYRHVQTALIDANVRQGSRAGSSRAASCSLPLRDAWHEAPGIVVSNAGARVVTIASVERRARPDRRRPRPRPKHALDSGDRGDQRARSRRCSPELMPAEPLPPELGPRARGAAAPDPAPRSPRRRGARRHPRQRSGPSPGTGASRPAASPAGSSTSGPERRRLNPGPIPGRTRPSAADENRIQRLSKDTLVGGGKRGQTLRRLGRCAAEPRGRRAPARRPHRDRAALPPGARATTPPSPAPRSCSARCSRSATTPDGAIELFDAAAPRVGELDALNVGFYNNYANALRRGKRYGQAEVILRQIVGVEPAQLAARGTTSARSLKDSRALRRGASRRCAARSRSRPSTVRITRCSARCSTTSAGCAAPTRRCAVHRARLGHRREPLDVARQHPAPARRSPRSDRVPRARARARRTAPPPRTATSRSRTRRSVASTSRSSRCARSIKLEPRQRHHALQRFVRVADRGRDRRRLGRVGVGPPRPARQRTPDAASPAGRRSTATAACSVTASRASATRSCSRRATPTSSRPRATS